MVSVERNAFDGSIELMSAQTLDTERKIATAVSLGGRVFSRHGKTIRIYFDVEWAVNHVPRSEMTDRERQDAIAEIHSVFYRPYYGWKVVGNRRGPWRSVVEDAIIARYDIDTCPDCLDTGYVKRPGRIVSDAGEPYCQCLWGTATRLKAARSVDAIISDRTHDAR